MGTISAAPFSSQDFGVVEEIPAERLFKWIRQADFSEDGSMPSKHLRYVQTKLPMCPTQRIKR